MMKYVFAIAIALLLAACNQDAPVMGSAAPNGTYASEAAGGRVKYTFENGRVRLESPTMGVAETTFVMDGDVAKFQFEGGGQMALKNLKDGAVVDLASGNKFVKK